MTDRLNCQTIYRITWCGKNKIIPIIFNYLQLDCRDSLNGLHGFCISLFVILLAVMLSLGLVLVLIPNFTVFSLEACDIVLGLGLELIGLDFSGLVNITAF